MGQNNNEEKWVSAECQKNQRALGRPLDFKNLNRISQEYFLAEWHDYVSDIYSISFCMGIYYNNLHPYDEEFNCRILTPETDEIVAFHNEPAQNDDMYEYAVKNTKGVLEGKTKNIHTRASVFQDFYASPCENEDSLIDPYTVVWGIFENTESNNTIHEILKRVMLDCVCESVASWNELVKISQIGIKEIKRLVELRKFDFMSSYRMLLYKQLQLPDEKIFREISFMPYEKRGNWGRMMFMGAGEFGNLNDTIKLTGDAKVNFSDKAMVRKLLEACRNEYYLVANKDDNNQILGYVKIDDHQNDSKTRVKFDGEGKYKIFVGQQEVLRFERAEYHIFIKTDREVKNFSGKLQDWQKQTILDWAKDITHGALFIFIKTGIDDELKRLCDKCRRGFRVDSISVKNFKDFVSGMAAVDGAVLVDYEGNCRAYGVILDGIAKVKGNPQRGARFNSAINYIFGEERTAVIISEDMEKPIYTINGKDLERNPNIIFDE